MDILKINVGTLPIGNNPLLGQTERAILKALTESQLQEIEDSSLYRDVEIEYSQGKGWPGNSQTLNTYVGELLSYQIEYA